MTAGRAYTAPSLRPFDTDDTSDVVTLWEHSLRNTDPVLSDTFIAAERDNLINIYLAKTRTLLAHLDGQLVGFISRHHDEIAGLFVAPFAQGRGVGRELVTAMCTENRPITVEVLMENHTAVGFYSHLGFVETGTRIHDTAHRPLIQMTLGHHCNRQTKDHQ